MDCQPASVAGNVAADIASAATIVQPQTTASDSKQSAAPTTSTFSGNGRKNFLAIKAKLDMTKGENDADILKAIAVLNDQRCSPPLTPAELDEVLAYAKELVKKSAAEQASVSAASIARALSSQERNAKVHANAIIKLIEEKKGEFIQDDSGNLFVRLDGETIALDETIPRNYGLDRLLMKRGLPGATSPTAKYAVRWLQMYAHSKTKGVVVVRRFSGLSADEKRLYVPTTDGLLQISADGVHTGAVNGENQDRIAVGPADGQHPFTYTEGDPKEGLRLYEQLIVNKQAVASRELGWLLAMQETLFPFFRTAYQDRFIPIHLGSHQSGKSSGARWFATLLGFDELKGDYTPAAIRSAGDVGVFFLDNREQANLDRKMQDLLLFMATGGENGRGTQTGGLRKSTARPVFALTSIEGPDTAELKSRCVGVRFALTTEQMKSFRPKENLQAIKAERDRMLSALMRVLQRFMQMEQAIVTASDSASVDVPDGAARFQDNYRAICRLLHAYADVAGKPSGWADAIVKAWYRHLSAVEPTNDRLEFLVRKFIEEKATDAEMNGDVLDVEPASAKRHKLAVPDLRIASVSYQGKPGTLYITHCPALFDWMKQNGGYDATAPASSQALAARLNEISGPTLRVLRENDVEDEPALRELLKRKNTTRFIGLFVPDENAGT